MTSPHTTEITEPTAAPTTAQRTTSHRLGPVEAIPPGEGRAFTIGAEQIAVFRLRDTTLRATQAACPHAGGPLADGQSDSSAIVCPLHGRAFSFTDGTCAEGEQITLYPVHDDHGEIVIEI